MLSTTLSTRQTFQLQTCPLVYRSINSFALLMNPRTLAQGLMIAGLLPFAALFVMALLNTDLFAATARSAYAAYGAIIVSFLGGIHWGYAILLTKSTQGRASSSSDQLANSHFVISNVVALIAWASVLFHSFTLTLGVQIAALLVALAADRRAFRIAMIPGWFFNLRKLITLLVVSSHLLLLLLSLTRSTI